MARSTDRTFFLVILVFFPFFFSLFTSLKRTHTGFQWLKDPHKKIAKKNYVFSVRKNSQSKNTSLLRKQSDPKNENLNNYTEAIFPSAQDKRTNYITRK